MCPRYFGFSGRNLMGCAFLTSSKLHVRHFSSIWHSDSIRWSFRMVKSCNYTDQTDSRPAYSPCETFPTVTQRKHRRVASSLLPPTRDTHPYQLKVLLNSRDHHGCSHPKVVTLSADPDQATSGLCLANRHGTYEPSAVGEGFRSLSLCPAAPHCPWHQCFRQKS
jgi:hypothetical protein